MRCGIYGLKLDRLETLALIRAVRAAKNIREFGAVQVPVPPGGVTRTLKNDASAAWLELRVALAAFTDSAEKVDG